MQTFDQDCILLHKTPLSEIKDVWEATFNVRSRIRQRGCSITDEIDAIPLVLNPKMVHFNNYIAFNNFFSL